MFGYCWASVSDAGPTVTEHWFNVSCLLGNIVKKRGGVWVLLVNFSSASLFNDARRMMLLMCPGSVHISG